MSRIKVGEILIPEPQDFELFKNTCDETDGWKQLYHKGDTIISMKDNKASDYKLAKGSQIVRVANAATLYDIIHDSIYRKTWDKGMIEGKELCSINSNNDIGYYALQAIPPFQNRDFVTQRSWQVTDTEYIVFNHSVFHKKAPPRKNFVRGVSFLTGYMIRPISDTSCHFTYLAQCDPKGYLPAWFMNQCTQYVAPRMMQRLLTAAANYLEWKADNRPDYKPWLYPEQLQLEKINWDDVQTEPDFVRPIDERDKRESEHSMERYMEQIGDEGGMACSNGGPVCFK